MNENTFSDIIETADFFEEKESIPDEHDPFCNSTEYHNYSESYSEILPFFFFRSKELPPNSSEYESKKLKHFYNTTGIFLSSGIMLKTAFFLILFIISFFTMKKTNPGIGFFDAYLSDYTIKYSFLTLSTVFSALFIVLAGCKCTNISPSSFFKSRNSERTSEMFTFFMTACFVSSIQNIINTALSFFTGNEALFRPVFSDSIKQMLVIMLYNSVIIPICSGLVFQGFVLKNLTRAGQRFGIISTSVLYALSCGSVYSLIPGFFMSVLFSKMTIKYNTVFPSILISMAVSAANMIIFAFGDIFMNSYQFIIMIWSAFLFLTGIFFTFFSIMKHPLPKSVKSQKSRTLSLFFRSPFILITVIFYIAVIIADFKAASFYY